MGKYDDALMELAGRQHFVVARDQLLEIGSARQVDDRLKRGVLVRMHQGAYRVARAPRSWRQDLIAACFAGGKTNVGSFRAAAQMVYLPGGQELVEVTSLRHRRTRHDGIVPHESRFLTETDVMYVDNIPITRPARTINDLGLLVARGELTLQVLDHAMHDAVRRNLVDVESVWREWERLGGDLRPGGRVVETMLHKFVPPRRRPDTSPEIRLLQLIRAAGLPEPVPQFRVWLSATRWVDLDHAWPSLKRYAEFDSYKYHGNRDKYMKDAWRRLALRKKKWDGVHVTDDELDSGAELALAVLADMLQDASLTPQELWVSDASVA